MYTKTQDRKKYFSQGVFMISNNSGLTANALKARGKKISSVNAYIKGIEYSIEDVHDSRWQYEISYSISGKTYSGFTYQYIHSAPSFVMKYFSKLYEEGGEILIRIDSDNPESYDANMDYAIVMTLGPDYVGSNGDYVVDIKDVFEVKNCAEVIIKGKFYDDTHFTKTVFKLLSKGYVSFIFNVTEVLNYSILISGAIGWAMRYASAFTNDRKFAVLLKKNQRALDTLGGYENRKDIIDKFTSNYLTEEEKKYIEYLNMTEEERKINDFKKYRSAEEYANEMMIMNPLPVFTEKTIQIGRKLFEGKKELTKSEERIKRFVDEYETIDIEFEREKLRIIY